VIIAANGAQHMVLTDQRGTFSFPNLFAGEYSIKVTLSKFLPVTKTGIQLSTGGTAVLTVNLRTAMDVMRRALAGQRSDSQDVVWTLRSSRSTQPVLYLAAERNSQEKSLGLPEQDYSGNLELYSKSVDTPAGPDQGVGSQFNVTKPLDPRSKIIVAGLYSDSPSQPRGFGARYEYSPSQRRHTTVAVGMKQGLLVSDTPNFASAHDLQADYREDVQWTDHWLLNYGAAAGRAGSLNAQNYFRPTVGMSWVPNRHTIISVVTSSDAPITPGDPSRNQEYFERSIYLSPAAEHYSHSEVSVSRILSDRTEVVAALFRDRTGNEAVFFNSSEGSGIMLLDTREIPSQGGRIYIKRHFRNFEAGAGYTTATGLSFPSGASLTDLSHQLETHQFQVVTTHLKADVDSTQTEVTATYRWVSRFSASEIDAYQHVVESNDPALSVSIAQNLPTWRMFPGKLQAVLDARNLLDHPFGSQNVQLAQSPKFLKGGINIKF
jgi:hypothetical protein